MKLRTILTSVGVMIGTAAIVAMISLSLGLKENAVKRLENFGNLTELDVAPSYMMPDEKTPRPPDRLKRLNEEAVRELKQIPGVQAVMPTKRLNAEVKIKLGRREGYLQLVGVDVRESALYKQDDVEKGTYLTGLSHEIVVSYEIPRQMRDVEQERREARSRRTGQQGEAGPPRGPFGEGGPSQAAIDMVGKTATLVLTRQYFVDDEPKFERKEVRVRVVGQLQKTERDRFGGTAFVPLSLIQELNEWANRGMEQQGGPFGGPDAAPKRSRTRDQRDEMTYDEITVKVAKREQVESVVQQLRQKGYEVYSPARALEEINKFFFVVQMILGGIAAVSLLVASIGIVNTMIMSILERTREIGIMKVIGATVYNIRWLFLIESGFIGLIGGLTGLGLAWGAVELVNYLGKQSGALEKYDIGGPEGVTQLAVIPFWLALFAIGFSFLIGLLAGLFPAFRASRLSALQAIRSE
jgi:acetoin utilization transport system permease protein